MHRHFKVSEIPIDEFNSHYLNYKLGSPRTLDSEYRNRKPKIRRFFRILNMVTYPCIETILDQLYDEQQKPDSVFYSGQMPISEAAIQTQKNYDDHRALLLEKEGDFNRLSVRLMRRRNKRSKHGRYKQDIFIFDKESELWVMRSFHIRDPNFGFYDFEGVEGNLNPQKVHAVCGIYTGLQNKGLEQTLKKYSPEELKVVRLTLKSGEEWRVVPKTEYEERSDREGIPAKFVPDLQGDNSRIKNGIENMVTYVREQGVPVSVDEETWDALRNPIPAFLIARHLE